MSEQSSFVDALLPAGMFGRNERLERISALLDWSRIKALVQDVRSGETGRPPYRPLAMLRALLLQQWYGLSDPGLEEALSDRVSFGAFWLYLMTLSRMSTTPRRFRNALKDAGLGEALFAEVSRQFDAAGFTIKAGTLIDASPAWRARCALREWLDPEGHREPLAALSRRQLDPPRQGPAV